MNGGPVGGFHSGADIANDRGTPVVAAAPARVAFVEEHPIRGLSVILDHGAGVKTGYHHLEAALVRPDDVVGAGTLIGRMGTSGYSTGPHLHWELTVYGVNVDPFTWTKDAFRP
ncbi:MAG: M23 family metallopeptidase [Dehalococcoidia bacterium]|nr:MAG: M23 family metallopeptidase [Dehalococcoidia bacterium]